MKQLPIFFIIALLSLSLVSALTLTRTLPINASDDFAVSYTVAGAPATYGVIIEDTVSGSCTFSDGTKIFKGVILSGDTGTLATSVTPSGNCVFSGAYSYSDGSTELEDLSLVQATVTYTGTATPGDSFLNTCIYSGSDGKCIVSMLWVLVGIVAIIAFFVFTKK
jgi:hypothetical protein